MELSGGDDVTASVQERARALNVRICRRALCCVTDLGAN